MKNVFSKHHCWDKSTWKIFNLCVTQFTFNGVSVFPWLGQICTLDKVGTGHWLRLSPTSQGRGCFSEKNRDAVTRWRRNSSCWAHYIPFYLFQLSWNPEKYIFAFSNFRTIPLDASTNSLLSYAHNISLFLPSPYVTP